MKRIYPRVQLEGTDLLRRVGVIYAQILGDLLMKVDEGEGEYPKGFFHTSTTNEMTPNYYHAMRSRDVGRGIIELCRAGMIDDVSSAVEYLLSLGLDCGDHYGRVLFNQKELEKEWIVTRHHQAGFAEKTVPTNRRSTLTFVLYNQR